jgi:hypothetical protein
VKKFILLMVLLGAVFCLYAQDLGDGVDIYDFDALYEKPADPPLIIGGDATEEKPQGFFDVMLSYLDNPKVTTRHLDRKRIFELKLFNLEANAGNNFIGMGDIFKNELVIDFNEVNRRIEGNGGMLNIGYDLSALRISVNPTERWGGSFGVNSSGRFDLTIPKELFELIAEGNEGKPVNKGRFVVSGGIFYEIGLNAHGTLPVLDEKLTIGVTPAFYSPLLYIPRSYIKYTLDTDGKLLIDANGKFTAYTALDTGAINAGAFFNSGGVDLSLSAEYALFSRLDVGLTLSHIPLVPARLDTGYELSFATKNGKPIMEIDDLTDFDPKMNELEFIGDDDFISLPAIRVFRPLRFDFYNIYRPFNNDFLSVRPNIGLTALTASGEVYLNMGTRVSLDLSRVFVLYFDSGLEEDIWRHKLGFELNLRAFELDFEAGMRSQNYPTSWSAHGISAKLGVALGW